MKKLSAKSIETIAKLYQEAKHQKELEEKQLLPAKIAKMGQLILRYPWQALAVISLATTVFFEVLL